MLVTLATVSMCSNAYSVYISDATIIMIYDIPSYKIS